MEHVLADADLAWAITRAMLPGLAAPHKHLPYAACACVGVAHEPPDKGCWPLAEWLALSSLNAAFRAAMAPQPVSLRLRPDWAHKMRGAALARLRPRLAALELPPGDEAGTDAVLSAAFRWGATWAQVPPSAAQATRVECTPPGDEAGTDAVLSAAFRLGATRTWVPGLLRPQGLPYPAGC